MGVHSHLVLPLWLPVIPERSPWVSLAAARLPTPTGGCCPGRPCRVTSASTLFPEPAQAETKPPFLGRCVLRRLSHLSEHHSRSHPRPYTALHLETWDPIPPGPWTKGPTLWQEKGGSSAATICPWSKGLTERGGKQTQVQSPQPVGGAVFPRTRTPGPETSCGNRTACLGCPSAHPNPLNSLSSRRRSAVTPSGQPLIPGSRSSGMPPPWYIS